MRAHFDCFTLTSGQRANSSTFTFLSTYNLIPREEFVEEVILAVLFSSVVQYVPVGRLPISSLLVLPHFASKMLCIQGKKW